MQLTKDRRTTIKLFLRASALGAERVNGLWLSNAGGGAVNLLSRTFVNIAHRVIKMMEHEVWSIGMAMKNTYDLPIL